MKAPRAARRCPPRTMPNSAACLMELVVSSPPLARPTIFAWELYACSRKEAKSAVPNGWRTLPATLPPAASTKRLASRCIAWPNAKSAVRKNQVSPPCATIDLAALAATA